MIPTLGFATDHRPRNTRGDSNVQQVTACAENRGRKESAPECTYEQQDKPLAALYLLPIREDHTSEGNNTTPTHMDRSNGCTPERDRRRLPKSKRKMVCVETPHLGDNVTTSTDIGQTKRGPHHQRPGDCGIHCAPSHFMSFDGADEPYLTKVDTTTAEVWVRQGRVISSTALGSILREVEWISRQTQTHYSVS